MNPEITSTHYRKVPIWRRGAALFVDFATIGLLSALIGQSLAAIGFLFIVGWLGLRVIWVSKNLGQSFGRWAFDMKVVDARLGGTPGLQELAKREGILGGAAMLFLIGLIGLLSYGPAAAWALLFFIPLAADCSLAYTDRLLRQTFHDQIAGTMVVQTRRGYSLDLKIKRLLVEAQRRMK